MGGKSFYFSPEGDWRRTDSASHVEECAALWGSYDHPDEMEVWKVGCRGRRRVRGRSVAAWKVMLEPTESGLPTFPKGKSSARNPRVPSCLPYSLSRAPDREDCPCLAPGEEGRLQGAAHRPRSWLRILTQTAPLLRPRPPGQLRHIRSSPRPDRRSPQGGGSILDPM